MKRKQTIEAEQAELQPIRVKIDIKSDLRKRPYGLLEGAEETSTERRNGNGRRKRRENAEKKRRFAGEMSFRLLHLKKHCRKRRLRHFPRRRYRRFVRTVLKYLN